MPPPPPFAAFPVLLAFCPRFSVLPALPPPHPIPVDWKALLGMARQQPAIRLCPQRVLCRALFLLKRQSLLTPWGGLGPVSLHPAAAQPSSQFLLKCFLCHWEKKKAQEWELGIVRDCHDTFGLLLPLCKLCPSPHHVCQAHGDGLINFFLIGELLIVNDSGQLLIVSE